jgi:hypothetical protein
MMNYLYPWPIGTISFRELPQSYKNDFEKHLIREIGAIYTTLEPHDTATEGPFVMFSGYKVRVKIEPTGKTTYKVRLV